MKSADLLEQQIYESKDGTLWELTFKDGRKRQANFKKVEQILDTGWRVYGTERVTISYKNLNDFLKK